ncbi:MULTISPECIES: spore coat protein U domain-containing protein [unclassified Brenneria]|uniref:spore coat protein U domain-containing protein n=1 Tax=unclassified Brenneria TaxID=2634434 RepID=UPI0018F0E5F9|nr:spore coat protein U domain-containing protein [Brenneria sp. L3-3C-1]MBJ7223714.1 spore coat protein U domain-containing protein [Brenneria sp. L3-3C-1]MEE3644956.1 spore coat protein U domain-containing protein [Brenneria sp. L3_3C_1]
MRLTTLLCLLTLLPVEVLAYSCAISTTALNFGAIEGITGTSLQSTATFTVKCQADTDTDSAISYQIMIDGAETGGQRQMTNGNHTTHYQLYTSGNNQQIWDSSTGTLTDSYTLVADTSETRTYTVYASMAPSFQDVPGTYLDTRTINLVY